MTETTKEGRQSAAPPDRRELLEQCGRAYGELGLAINFTDGITGDSAKQNTSGWKGTERLPHPARGVALLTANQHRNPIVALGASGLIGVDVDGRAGVELLQTLNVEFPFTVVVRTGRADDGWHLWYRPAGGEESPVWKAQLADKVTVSRDGYLVCPPAVHPDTGTLYRFARGREPWTIPIAELPVETLVALREFDRTATVERRRNLSGPVYEGERHEHLRQISYAMRRYSGASEECIKRALLAENELRCVPPQHERLVRALVADTYMRVTPIGQWEELRAFKLGNAGLNGD